MFISQRAGLLNALTSSTCKQAASQGEPKGEDGNAMFGHYDVEDVEQNF